MSPICDLPDDGTKSSRLDLNGRKCQASATKTYSVLETALQESHCVLPTTGITKVRLENQTKLANGRISSVWEMVI